MTDRVGVYTSSRGDALQLRSGRAYYPCNPDPADVLADDVAYSLARVPRFGGHTTTRPYPVLEHLVRAVDLSLLLDGFSPFGVVSHNGKLSASPAPAPSIHATPYGAAPQLRTTSLSAILSGLGHDWRSAAVQSAAARALDVAIHDVAEAFIGDVTRPLKVNLPDFQRYDRLNDAAVERAFIPWRRALPLTHASDATWRGRIDVNGRLFRAPDNAVAAPCPRALRILVATDGKVDPAYAVVDPSTYTPKAPPGVDPRPPCTCGVDAATEHRAEMHAHVKRVDNLILAAERDQLMTSEADGGLPWGSLPAYPICDATNMRLTPWMHDLATPEERRAIDDADLSAGLARTTMEALRRRLDGGFRNTSVGPSMEVDLAEAEMEYLTMAEEARSIRLRLAWHRRISLLRAVLVDAFDNGAPTTPHTSDSVR